MLKRKEYWKMCHLYLYIYIFYSNIDNRPGPGWDYYGPSSLGQSWAVTKLKYMIKKGLCYKNKYRWTQMARKGGTVGVSCYDNT